MIDLQVAKEHAEALGNYRTPKDNTSTTEVLKWLIAEVEKHQAVSSLKLCKLGSLVYPIMLAQEAGEISEAKAAELLALDLLTYRECKAEATQAILNMVEKLPSPLRMLLGTPS